jgi:hypothetical protein
MDPSRIPRVSFRTNYSHFSPKFTCLTLCALSHPAAGVEWKFQAEYLTQTPQKQLAGKNPPQQPQEVDRMPQSPRPRRVKPFAARPTPLPPSPQKTGLAAQLMLWSQGMLPARSQPLHPASPLLNRVERPSSSLSETASVSGSVGTVTSNYTQMSSVTHASNVTRTMLSSSSTFSDEEISFLVEQLEDDDDDQKAAQQGQGAAEEAATAMYVNGDPSDV